LNKILNGVEVGGAESLQSSFNVAAAVVDLRPNSITLSWSQTGPRLVADLQRTGTYDELAGLRPASDLSATRIA